MTRKALLIGSDYGDLRGVRNDLRVMTVALEGRGFDVRRCEPPHSTRDGILTAYEKLIADVEPGDAVVVFYSGHGGRVEARPFDAGDALDGAGYRPMDLQFIVPLDFDEGGSDDFRGITSVELSLLQLRLTRITQNVTVILDCCHSGQMSKYYDQRPRTVASQPYRRVRDHIDRLAAGGLNVQDWRSEGNRHAVRVVACAPQQTAAEYPGIGGEWIGALTEALTLTLTEVGEDEVTWSIVMDRVRRRLGDRAFRQRPEAEGPYDRKLFSTETDDPLTSLPVTPAGRDDIRARLGCAPLLGVQTGDEFVIMPPGSTAVDRPRRVGTLVVEEVDSVAAGGSVAFAPGQRRLPIGARAFRTKVTAPRIRLRVPVDDPHTARLVSGLPVAGLVQLVEPGDGDWAAEIVVGPDGRLTLQDRLGPLRPPLAADDDGIGELLRALKALAQAGYLRALVQSPAYALDAPVTIDWGLVEDGRARPLEPAGATVAAGERIYVTVRNKGLVPVYVSLIDLGMSGSITVLTRNAPSGRELAGGESYTFGRNELDGSFRGQRLSWPSGLEKEHAREETLLVVITSDRLDLSPLEQPGSGAKEQPKGVVSPLQAMINQLDTGWSREVEPDEEDGVRYDVRAIDFRMTQEPRP
ncbi:MAG TPA: caspase family protein [Dactylosporangium sp.]|nr:caspase family protein [Dactylosporangium sp.]